MTTLSIVIPAYNEETGIAEIMNRVLSVREALKSAGVEGFELLVVNDGSRDQTRKVAEEIAQQSPDVRVINHPVNRGYGAALKTGFAQARGDLIGFLDADGTYPPEHFPQLCQAAMVGADLVIGSRMAGAESKMPAVRRIGNWLFATLLSILGWQRVTDSASGMRVFKRSSLEKLYPLPDGLNLTPVMSTRAIHEGLKVVEVPIPYSERVGRSKLSALRDGTIFLQSMVWTVMAYNPVRILATTDARTALTGADFVLSSAEFGRFEYRIQDYEIPNRHGARQINGENGGPGAVFHSLRSIANTPCRVNAALRTVRYSVLCAALPRASRGRDSAK